MRRWPRQETLRTSIRVLGFPAACVHQLYPPACAGQRQHWQYVSIRYAAQPAAADPDPAQPAQVVHQIVQVLQYWTVQARC